MDGSSPLVRAVRRARRREAVGRLADAVFAVVITLAAGASVLIVLRLFGVGSDFPPITIVLSGLMVGIVRWMFGTSGEAIAVASRLDQANRTRDLLASALSASGDDAWSRTLRAQADHACLELSYPPPLGRRTLRAHLAAIATLTAVTLVAGLVRYEGGSAGMIVSRDTAISVSPPAERTPISAALRTPGEASSESSVPDATAARDERAASSASDTTPRDTASDDAAGAGHAAAHADTAMATNRQSTEGVLPSADPLSGSQGSGRETKDSTGVAAGASVGTSDSAARASAVPWHAAGWVEAREAAITSVSSKDVPQDRREMVRAYFDR